MSDIYFDHASTSYPKPPQVVEAIQSYLIDAGCSPGRSGHLRARKSEKLLDRSRQLIASFLGCSKYENISYTYNATYALNQVIKASLKQDDHVVTTCLEHNSVLRPLEKLKRQGRIDYAIAGLDEDSSVNVAELEDLIQPNTTLIVINHASNVLGTINPIEKIIQLARKHDIKVLVDASQTAGFLDINIDELKPDYLVFTGHKSLQGLPGVGGLYVKDPLKLDTLIEGGTGGNSLSLMQPGMSPEKFEAGTCNYTGIVALAAGVQTILDEGLANIQQHERKLLEELTQGLRSIEKVTLYGDISSSDKVPIISFNVENIPANEVSMILDRDYGIMTRPGIQCAPLLHKALSTSPSGTVRLSLGRKNTKDEILRCIEAVQKIAQRIES